MNLIESCMAAAKAKPARVVFPDAIDERAIHAAQRLARQGWAKPVLLANPFELRRYCKQRGIVLGEQDAHQSSSMSTSISLRIALTERAGT